MKSKLFLLLVFLAHGNTGYGQMIVGHRGASHDAPENTVASFLEAWEQGADGVEGDFYFTADQQIVCIHDKDTGRTCSEKMLVSECTLAQLRTLEYGGWKNAKFKGEPIPTFADVAATVPEGKLFVIELKTGPEIVPLLVTELAKTKLKREQLLVIAFDSSTVAKSKELLPDVRAHWLTGYKKNVLTGAWSPSVSQICETIKSCSADGLGTQGRREVVNKQFVEHLKSQGVNEFHVWTVDEPADATYFQQLGAIGITTNRPAFIRQAISE